MTSLTLVSSASARAASAVRNSGSRRTGTTSAGATPIGRRPPLRRSDATSPPELRAIDKASGATVHSVVLPAAPTGSPMTYTVGGKQYIVLAYGAGSQTGLLGLALP